MTKEEVREVMKRLERDMLSRPETFYRNLTMTQLLIEIAHTAIHEAQED